MPVRDEQQNEKREKNRGRRKKEASRDCLVVTLPFPLTSLTISPPKSSLSLSLIKDGRTSGFGVQVRYYYSIPLFFSSSLDGRFQQPGSDRVHLPIWSAKWCDLEGGLGFEVFEEGSCQGLG